jgi:hypothetical protein
MKKFLEKYLKVYIHESPPFLWITPIAFVIFFVFAIFRNYVDTAFLKRYGPQYIPMMLVINALVTFVVLGIVDRLGRRFRDPFLLAAFLGIYSVLCTAIFFMVKADISLAYPILYQLLHLLDSILLVYLWNIAGDLFDARQGKRIFPLITAGQVLGTTLGSFATKPLTMALGEDPALLIFGGVCLATALYLGRTASGFVGAVAKPKASAATGATIRLPEVPRLTYSQHSVAHIYVSIQRNSQRDLSVGTVPHNLPQLVPRNDNYADLCVAVFYGQIVFLDGSDECFACTPAQLFGPVLVINRLL